MKTSCGVRFVQGLVLAAVIVEVEVPLQATIKADDRLSTQTQNPGGPMPLIVDSMAIVVTPHCFSQSAKVIESAVNVPELRTVTCLPQ